jgi:putative addiction module component (TIGR02574 family)
MSLTPEQLQAELLQLSPAIRARMAEALLDSLDEPDSEIEAAWAAEAKRRYAELESGAVKGIPSDEVFARARAQLNAPR